MARQSLAVPSPASQSVGYGLRVLDYDVRELQGTANAQGICELQGPYLSQDQLLRIERICVSGNSANLCQVTVYEGDQPITQRERDGTPWPAGTVAVSEYPAYLTIRPTLCLLIAITGANNGDQFQAAYQFQKVQRVLGQGAWPSS